MALIFQGISVWKDIRKDKEEILLRQLDTTKQRLQNLQDSLKNVSLHQLRANDTIYVRIDSSK